MTGGPTPVAGPNPYPKAYQTQQFDNTWPPAKNVLEALNDPPAAGITASTSPDKLFLENSNPPVGAGGNQG